MIVLSYTPTSYKGDIAHAGLWLSDRKLHWSGKVASPRDTAAVYVGKCPEGHVYATLPSYVEAEAAKWPSLEKDLDKAIQAVPEDTFRATGGVRDDRDLEPPRRAEAIRRPVPRKRQDHGCRTETPPRPDPTEKPLPQPDSGHGCRAAIHKRIDPTRKSVSG